MKENAQGSSRLSSSRTHARDRRDGRNLRRAGWRVVRLWEHELREAPEAVTARVLKALEALG